MRLAFFALSACRSVRSADVWPADARTSTSVFVKQWSHPLLELFAQRAANLTRVPPHYSEEMQVVHYDPKQHYFAVSDSFLSGSRRLTFRLASRLDRPGRAAQNMAGAAEGPAR